MNPVRRSHDAVRATEIVARWINPHAVWLFLPVLCARGCPERSRRDGLPRKYPARDFARAFGWLDASPLRNKQLALLGGEPKD
jgi:hypothetical protein